MKKLISLVLSIFLFISCSTFKQEQLILKCNLKKGESYPLKVITEQQTMWNNKGHENISILTSETGYMFYVSDIDSSGAASVNFRYTEIVLSDDSGIFFDSKDSTTIKLLWDKILYALVGKEVEMKIMPNGKIEGLSNVDELIDSLFRTHSEAKHIDGSFTRMREALKIRYGTQRLTENLEMIMRTFPDTPVLIGEKWSEEYEFCDMENNIPYTLQNTCTLRDINDGRAAIDFSAAIVSNAVVQPPGLGSQFKAKYDLEGEKSGTITFDVETGWPVSGESIQDIQGTVNNIYFDESVTQKNLKDADLKQTIRYRNIIRYEHGE